MNSHTNNPDWVLSSDYELHCAGREKGIHGSTMQVIAETILRGCQIKSRCARMAGRMWSPGWRLYQMRSIL